MPGVCTILHVLRQRPCAREVRWHAVGMRIFPAAVGAPHLHLLLGPLGIGQAVLQFDAEVDLLARHALFLDAILSWQISLDGTLANHMPEKSGLPSGVRGAGAFRSGAPLARRGIPGVG